MNNLLLSKTKQKSSEIMGRESFFFSLLNSDLLLSFQIGLVTKKFTLWSSKYLG